jgi:hypothetical protein
MAVTAMRVPRVAPGPFALGGVGGQLNTYLFTTTGAFTKDGQAQDLTDAQLVTLRERLDVMRPGHCRVFVERGLDPDTPKGRAAPAFDALVKTLDLAERAGATVNLTWWQGPYASKARLRGLVWPNQDRRDWPNPRLRKWPAALTAPEGPDGLPGPRRTMERFARLVRELRKDFACVTHATVQNEVNGPGRDIACKGVPNLSMRLYERLYRDFDAALSALRDPRDPGRSLREAITIVAGDLVQGSGGNHQDEWIAYLRANMDAAHDGQPSVLDAYSIHVYWTPREFPSKLEKRLEGLDTLLGRLGTDKPVYVTEYGVRELTKPASARPGIHRATGLPMEHAPEAAFQLAWFDALALQRRCVGLVKWVAYRTDVTSGFGRFGLIDAPSAGFGQTPGYEITRLFNDLLGERWAAVGLARSTDRLLLASRFGGPGGQEESLVALNRDDRARDVELGGLSAGRRYQRADFNRGGRGNVERRPPIVARDGSITVSVPQRGLVALSTRALTV